MTEFNLDALEQALKPRERKKGLKLEAYSREELIYQVKRMAGELKQLNMKELKTKHDGESWEFEENNNCFICGYRRQDDDDIPIEVLKRMVANGQKKLKSYHDMIDHLVVSNPEIALEANLEGKSGTEVLGYAYGKRVKQIQDYIDSYIVVPRYGNTRLFIRLNVNLDVLNLEMNYWIGEGGISLGGVALNPTNQEEGQKLLFFLTNFDKVLAGIDRQLSKIKIKGGDKCVPVK